MPVVCLTMHLWMFRAGLCVYCSFILLLITDLSKKLLVPYVLVAILQSRIAANVLYNAA